MSTQTMTRSEMIERTKTKLDEWDAALSRLESKADRMKVGAQSELRARLTATRKALDEAKARWAKHRETAANVWDSVSEELGEAWDANRKALQRSVDELTAAFDES